MTYTLENNEVKSNAVELLVKVSPKKRENCMIITGEMTDPYIPLEKELMNTRIVLKL